MTMRKPIVILTLTALITMLSQVGLWLYRPMFADSFGRGDGRFFATWHGRHGITFDASGNGFKIDRQLNTIVLFEDFVEEIHGNPGEVEYRKMFLGSSYRPGLLNWLSGAEFQSMEGTRYVVPRTPNTVIVFDRSGNPTSVNITPGTATELSTIVHEGKTRDVVKRLKELAGRE